MPVTWIKATKEQSRARVGLVGPAGSGKTYTGLLLATGLGNRIAVIDTERGSAAKYADEFNFSHVIFDNFDPRVYIEAIESAGENGFDVLLIDSLSHAWTGKGGVLELQAATAKRSKSGNTFDAWREVTPLHNRLVDTILQSPLHVIVTMRVKTEYIVEEQQRNGRIIHVPKKVGMAPIQREGLDYEFDVVGDLDLENNWTITKSRCKALHGQVINRPDLRTAKVISDWLTDGVKTPEAGVVDNPPRNESPNIAVSPTPAPAGWRSKQDKFNLQREQELANKDRARVDNDKVTRSDVGEPKAAGPGDAPALEGGPVAQPEQDVKPSVSPASPVPSPVEEACQQLKIAPQRAWLFLMQHHRDTYSDLRKVGDFLALEGERAKLAIDTLKEEFK